MYHLFVLSVGRGEDESQEDVLMDEAPSNISQASTLQANREGKPLARQSSVCIIINNSCCNCFHKLLLSLRFFSVSLSFIRLYEHPGTRG